MTDTKTSFHVTCVIENDPAKQVPPNSANAYSITLDFPNPITAYVFDAETDTTKKPIEIYPSSDPIIIYEMTDAVKIITKLLQENKLTKAYYRHGAYNIETTSADMPKLRAVFKSLAENSNILGENKLVLASDGSIKFLTNKSNNGSWRIQKLDFITKPQITDQTEDNLIFTCEISDTTPPERLQNYVIMPFMSFGNSTIFTLPKSCIGDAKVVDKILENLGINRPNRTIAYVFQAYNYFYIVVEKSLDSFVQDFTGPQLEKLKTQSEEIDPSAISSKIKELMKDRLVLGVEILADKCNIIYQDHPGTSSKPKPGSK